MWKSGPSVFMPQRPSLPFKGSEISAMGWVGIEGERESFRREGWGAVSGTQAPPLSPSLPPLYPAPLHRSLHFFVPKLHTLICCVQSCKASWQEHWSVSGLWGNKYTWVFSLNELKPGNGLTVLGRPSACFPPRRPFVGCGCHWHTAPWVPALGDRCPPPTPLACRCREEAWVGERPEWLVASGWWLGGVSFEG